MKKKMKNVWKWLMANRKRLIFVSFILIFVFVLGIIFSKRNSNKITYQTTAVAKGTLVSTVTASGQVLTTNTLAITTEASGVVKKVFVKDGDYVTVGQKLAEITLDTAGLENNAKAYASYVSAQNGVNSANNSYRSAVASVEKVLDEVKGHDTDETFAQKETRTKAEVAWDNAYDGLRQSQANLTSAYYSYRLTSPTITAPFSGTIESVNLVEGMVLESASSTTSINSQRVAVVKGDSFPVINITLSEVDVPKVKVGQKVTVTLDSLADKTFTGIVATVDRVGSVSNNVTSYTAKIKLDSSSSEILPNMAATANIILATRTEVLIAPAAAIVSQNGTTLAKVLKNGKEEGVEVKTGLETDTEIEIISGLSEGDLVITGTTAATTNKTSTTQTRSVFSSGFGGMGGPR